MINFKNKLKFKLTAIFNKQTLFKHFSKKNVCSALIVIIITAGIRYSGIPNLILNYFDCYYEWTRLTLASIFALPFKLIFKGILDAIFDYDKSKMTIGGEELAYPSNQDMDRARYPKNKKSIKPIDKGELLHTLMEYEDYDDSNRNTSRSLFSDRKTSYAVKPKDNERHLWNPCKFHYLGCNNLVHPLVRSGCADCFSMRCDWGTDTLSRMKHKKIRQSITQANIENRRWSELWESSLNKARQDKYIKDSATASAFKDRYDWELKMKNTLDPIPSDPKEWPLTIFTAEQIKMIFEAPAKIRAEATEKFHIADAEYKKCLLESNEASRKLQEIEEKERQDRIVAQQRINYAFDYGFENNQYSEPNSSNKRKRK
nr:hypothetical protein [Ophiocordyceps sp.]